MPAQHGRREERPFEMKCESCQQRQATVVLTTVMEDEKTVLRLCSACAREKGFEAEPAPGGEGTVATHEHAAEAERENDEKLRCPRCGLTFARFKERYRLGCAECYGAFRERLRPLLRKVHNAEAHTGKRFARSAEPKTPAQETRTGTWTMELLKRRLTAAIEREEFEEAARLRDQVEALKLAQSKERDAS